MECHIPTTMLDTGLALHTPSFLVIDSTKGELVMLKMDGMQKKEEESMFEEWTKELEKELSNFWTEFLK